MISCALMDSFVQMEVMDENEWWAKMEQLKNGGEKEIVIRQNFKREDQDILADMAYQFGLHL